MSILTVFIIAIGLAMDAFAVSISSGIALRRMQARHALLIASFFGAFQAIMPLIGWGAGRWARTFVAAFDHWIAFGLLVAIGIKIIYEALRGTDREVRGNPLSLRVLLLLAVATSIDALAVGVTLPFLDVAIMIPAIVIGLVTFAMSFAGTYLGSAFGHLFERKTEILAGLLLIGIGVKILIEHTLL